MRLSKSIDRSIGFRRSKKYENKESNCKLQVVDADEACELRSIYRTEVEAANRAARLVNGNAAAAGLGIAS
jgi:hypothetical protein